MPLSILWYINIPKECFSPLKHSTSVWACYAGRSTARSRSTASQKLTIKSVNVLHKSFRFIPEAVCFKSRRRPCFIHQNSTGDGAHYTHEHFPPGNVWVCCQSPEDQKRVGQWWGCLTPLCPSRNASSGLWWADRGRLMCWDSFTVPVQQMAQQRP